MISSTISATSALSLTNTGTLPTRREPPDRGPPTDWGELVQVHDDRDIFQASPQELPVIDIHRR